MQHIIRTFDQDVYPAIQNAFCTQGRQPNQPHFVLIAAQPGAGKTTNRRRHPFPMKAGEALTDVDVDALRSFHPFFNSFSQAPFVMAEATGVSASAWYMRLMSDAFRQRNHILAEGGGLGAMEQRAYAHALRAAGYTSEVRYLAVPWRVSMLGIMQRFEKALLLGEPARWVSFALHNKRFEQLPVTLAAIEQAGLCDKVGIYARDGSVLHEQTGLSHVAGLGTAAFLAEQNRMWTAQEKEKHLEDVTALRDHVMSRDSLKPDWYMDVLDCFTKQAESIVKGRDQNGPAQRQELADLEAPRAADAREIRITLVKDAMGKSSVPVFDAIRTTPALQRVMSILSY